MAQQQQQSSPSSCDDYCRFDHLLGLVPLKSDRKRVTYEPKERCLTVRMPVSRQIASSSWTSFLSSSSINNNNTKQGRILLSTYLSIVDEVTTMALFEAGVEKGSLGVSLSLHAQLLQPLTLPLQTLDNDNNNNELEVEARVSKLGQTVAFLTATVRHSQCVVCHASHIKYLPQKHLGWATDLALSRWGWPWLTWWYGVDTLAAEERERRHERDLLETEPLPSVSSVLHEGLVLCSDEEENDNNNLEPHKATTTFTVSRPVTNGMGTLHGGAHAHLVELVAQRHVNGSSSSSTDDNAAKANANEEWHLQSLHMEYQSAVPMGAQVKVHVIGDSSSSWNHKENNNENEFGASTIAQQAHDNNNNIHTRWIQVHIVRQDDKNRVASSGLCQFVKGVVAAAAEPDEAIAKNSTPPVMASKL